MMEKANEVEKEKAFPAVEFLNRNAEVERAWPICLLLSFVSFKMPFG